MKTNYYLISTINNQLYGYSVYCSGSKKECQVALENEKSFMGTDIYADTLNKNARIVCKTIAKRIYHIEL